MPITLHVWRVPRRRVVTAMFRLAFPGPHRTSFAKFLGTADGFRPGDADLTRYAAVTVSDDPVILPKWDRLAVSSARIDLTPLHSRGTWSRQKPFESDRSPSRGGMVLALTRARLRPTRAAAFWKAIAPVAPEVDQAPGLLAHFGIGEAPIGFQGTISVWRDAADLARFAYRQPEHRAVIARTPTDGWYAEELFARFAVDEISGDRDVLGWNVRGA
ncbi:monooxygenase [Paractinoplanes hotanensis]|uniref:Monooxygenase n=1 Tax=Paractinoplanes hotanensis TaxID=2906497 RepID=A0ABT0Y6S6_9ACTN|nr:monooxygenase [Actinoplanes hotanensis]MCM4081540.1 monooxygenase [Actinoplanes hotanensis]